MSKQYPSKTSRGEESRKKILEITASLIGQYDSASVTLDQIAQECEISKSSIIWHFGSKEALFIEVIDSIFRNLEKIIVEQCPENLSTADKFVFFLDSYKQMLKKHPEAPKIFFSFVFNSQVRKKIDERIRYIYEWNRKAFCEQFNMTETQSVLFLGMLNGIIIQAEVHPNQIDIDKVFSEMASLIKEIL